MMQKFTNPITSKRLKEIGFKALDYSYWHINPDGSLVHGFPQITCSSKEGVTNVKSYTLETLIEAFPEEINRTYDLLYLGECHPVPVPLELTHRGIGYGWDQHEDYYRGRKPHESLTDMVAEFLITLLKKTLIKLDN